MPGRITPLVNYEFYHLFNRGSDKRNLFLQPRDYGRFQQTFYYYQFSELKAKFSTFSKSNLNNLQKESALKLVEIICYCSMPNHFHFLVRQLKTNGISTFMSKLSNSYTKYFNTKYKRTGPLLEGAFKAVLIKTDDQLIHLSRYIHLNPIVSGITKNLNDYPWSSYYEYISGKPNICSINHILGFFPSTKKYQEFVESRIEYGTTLEILKHKTIDY